MTDAEKLEWIRNFIREREHVDDWDVPCVYTKALREFLEMEESPL